MKGILVAAALLALPAWAVGERITISGPVEAQLKETLCIPMDCGAADGAAARVVSKASGDSVEVRVIAADGTVRWSQKLPLNDEGRVPSMELMTASTLMVKAIESPQARAEAAPALEARPKAKVKVAKKAPTKKSVRLAMVRTR